MFLLDNVDLFYYNPGLKWNCHGGFGLYLHAGKYIDRLSLDNIKCRNLDCSERQNDNNNNNNTKKNLLLQCLEILENYRILAIHYTIIIAI